MRHAGTMEAQRLDWSLLRSFLAVVDAGSLMGAARVLGVPQPTITRHIAALEAQLAVALFERTGRGAVPTAAGHAMLEAARQVEQGVHAVSRAVVGQRLAVQGTVRVSASQVVAVHLLPQVLRALQAAEPGLQIELVSTNAVSDLLRREADIAIRMARPTQSALVARRIAEVPLGLYAHGDYLAAAGVPRKAADLAKHRLVGLDADDTLTAAMVAAGAAVRRDSFCLRTDDHLAYARCVGAGAGIGVLAAFVARGMPQLQRVLPKLAIAPMPCWLAVHREIRSNPLMRKVFDHLAEAVPVEMERGIAA